MKEPERLIRKFYSDNNITHGATILFSYVRKSTTGGDWAVIEYYAAKYGYVKSKKKKDIVTKLVMKFNPDTYRYSHSESVIQKSSWSIAFVDHLAFDFHKEIASYDYSKDCGCETGGNKLWRSCDWSRTIMPTSEIPLNDFSGTKYEYCKYLFKGDEYGLSNKRSYGYWAKNPYGNLPDYLRKFNINPQAMELFASKGLVKYMKDSFLKRLRDDKPFAKWYRKHAIEMLGKSIYEIENRARREIGKTCWEIVAREDRKIEKKRRERIYRRRLARQEREEMRRMEEVKKQQEEERKNRKKRIRDLFCQLKSICRMAGAYEVIIPKTEGEMVKEGRRMHNCVGRCYTSRHGVDCIIVFLHKKGKPCVDVQIDMETYKVVQCRAVCNYDADESAKKTAEKVASEIKRIREAA